MTRWMIEKSGSGIEKAGSGIEKAGSGIEKEGSGIEKAGSGIQKHLMALALTAVTFSSSVLASDLRPEGALMVATDQGTVTVSWAIEGSVFAGVASLNGTYSQVDLMEIGLAPVNDNLAVAGSGTGKEVAGSGTGIEVAGSGTGIEVAGSGTGIEVAGSGTGIEVAGSGTGIEVAGSGTGTEIAGFGTGTEVAGSGTGRESESADGSTILVAGSGTGSEAIAITLPRGTGMHMEITMGCSSATVSVLDSNSSVVTTFNDVPVIGNTGLCARGGSGAGHARFEAAMR